MNTTKLAFRLAIASLAALPACSSKSTGGNPGPDIVYPDGSVAPTPACLSEGGTAPVAKPVRIHTMTGDKSWAETGWFSSPGLVDLNGDGTKESSRRFTAYSCSTARAMLSTIKQDAYTKDRIYAPAVVADFDGDGVTEIVAAGNQGNGRGLRMEKRRARHQIGLAGLDDERRPIARSARHGRGRSRRRRQGRGRLHHHQHLDDRRAGLRLRARRQALPAGGHELHGLAALQHAQRRRAATPTPTARRKPATAATGSTSASATSTTTPELEIIVTYDNHQINAFNHDGTRSSPRPTSRTRRRKYLGKRLGWGQFIRWADPTRRGEPLPPAHRRLARPEQRPDVAPVDGLAADGRRPRRRRQERGRRLPQRRDAASPT